MSDPHRIVELVKQWVDKAEDDLRTAEHVPTMREDCPFGIVCYHSQQAVEKYVKALLTWRSIPFHKVHDIGELINLLSDLNLPLSEVEQDLLTDYATETRYPGEREPITRADAKQVLILAQRTRDTVRAHLLSEVTHNQ